MDKLTEVQLHRRTRLQQHVPPEEEKVFPQVRRYPKEGAVFINDFGQDKTTVI